MACEWCDGDHAIDDCEGWGKVEASTYMAHVCIPDISGSVDVDTVIGSEVLCHHPEMAAKMLRQYCSRYGAVVMTRPEEK